MASGAWEWTGTGGSWVAGRMVFSSYSNGSANNTSEVQVDLYGRRSDGGNSYNYDSSSFWVEIDGTRTYRGSGISISGSSWQHIWSNHKTVGHNNDGTKLCHAASGGGITNSSFQLGEYHVDVWLESIPRYASITYYYILDIGQDYVTASFGVDSEIDALRVYLNNSSSYRTFSVSSSLTGNGFKYDGLAPGTTYNIKFAVKRKDSQLWTTSSNATFTTKPIAKITNSNCNFVIGSDITLNFSNSANNASSIRLDVMTPTGGWQNGVVTANNVQAASWKWSLSTVTSALYQTVTTRNTANIRIWYGVTISGTTHGGYVHGVMTVANSNPTFSTYSYGNADTTTNNILGNTSYMISGRGDMQTHISVANKAVAKNYATISKYVCRVYLNSTTAILKLTKEASFSSSAQVNIDLGAFQDSGTYTVQIYAVDSRGNTSSVVSKTFYVLPYHAPYGSIQLKRLNDFEQEIKFYYTIYYSRVLLGNVQKNDSFTSKYRYKEAGSDTWSDYVDLTGFTSVVATNTNDMQVTITNEEFMTLPSELSYDFQFTLTDKIQEITQSVYVSQGIPILVETENGKVGVGLVPDMTSPTNLQVGTDIMATDSSGAKKNVLEEISTLNSKLNTTLQHRGYVTNATSGTTSLDEYTYEKYGCSIFQISGAIIFGSSQQWTSLFVLPYNTQIIFNTTSIAWRMKLGSPANWTNWVRIVGTTF